MLLLDYTSILEFLYTDMMIITGLLKQSFRGRLEGDTEIWLGLPQAQNALRCEQVHTKCRFAPSATSLALRPGGL